MDFYCCCSIVVVKSSSAPHRTHPITHKDMSAALQNGAHLIHLDYRWRGKGFRRCFAFLSVTYAFTHSCTGLHTHHISNPSPALKAQGLRSYGRWSLKRKTQWKTLSIWQTYLQKNEQGFSTLRITGSFSFSSPSDFTHKFWSVTSVWILTLGMIWWIPQVFLCVYSQTQVS